MACGWLACVPAYLFVRPTCAGIHPDTNTVRRRTYLTCHASLYTLLWVALGRNLLILCVVQGGVRYSHEE